MKRLLRIDLDNNLYRYEDIPRSMRTLEEEDLRRRSCRKKSPRKRTRLGDRTSLSSRRYPRGHPCPQ